jgi:predicted ATPase
MGTALRGWALIEQGLAAEGLAELRDGTALWRVRGFAHFVPFFLGLQAEACLKLQMPQEARAALSAACAIVGSGADGYWRAEVYRLEGEVARAEGRNEGLAEAHFRQAIDAAREQDAKLLELRAASSLARLWRDQGRSQEARGMVAGVYDRFDEGFQTYDLQAAGTLLRALA